jgi:hypothetical protein
MGKWLRENAILLVASAGLVGFAVMRGILVFYLLLESAAAIAWLWATDSRLR